MNRREYPILEMLFLCVGVWAGISAAFWHWGWSGGLIAFGVGSLLAIALVAASLSLLPDERP